MREKPWRIKSSLVVRKTSLQSMSLARRAWAASMPVIPSMYMSINTRLNRWPCSSAAENPSPLAKAVNSYSNRSRAI